MAETSDGKERSWTDESERSQRRKLQNDVPEESGFTFSC